MLRQAVKAKVQMRQPKVNRKLLMEKLFQRHTLLGWGKFKEKAGLVKPKPGTVDSSMFASSN
jgi:hypothetical protein